MQIKIVTKAETSNFLNQFSEPAFLSVPFVGEPTLVSPMNMGVHLKHLVDEWSRISLMRRMNEKTLVGHGNSLDDLSELDEEWMQISFTFIFESNDVIPDMDKFISVVQEWSHKSSVPRHRGERMAFVTEMREFESYDNLVWECSALLHRVVHFSHRRACIYPQTVDDFVLDLNQLGRMLSEEFDLNSHLEIQASVAAEETAETETMPSNMNDESLISYMELLQNMQAQRAKKVREIELMDEAIISIKEIVRLSGEINEHEEVLEKTLESINSNASE